MADTRRMDPEEIEQANQADELEDAQEQDLAVDEDAEDVLDVPAPEVSEDAEPEVKAALSTQDAPSIFSRIKWGRVALAFLFAFIVAAAALFAWNRWYRFDDISDIQGTWRDVNSGATMEVNETHLKLAEDAVYEYHIDTTAKTISYSFAGGEGFSSYRFSEDRQKLVLEDGAEVDWSIVFHFQDDPGFAEGALPDGMTRLEKVSNEVPSIKLPGSERPAGALVQSEPQLSSSSSSSAAPAASSGSSSSSSPSSAPKASQTEPDENGLVVGPDRNAKGYYDSAGIFVPESYGHFDESGNWVEDAGGYYDDENGWVEGPTGYYDDNGRWVEYGKEENTSGSEASGNTSDGSEGKTGYYDQYGNWVDTSAWNNYTPAGEDANAQNDTQDDPDYSGDSDYTEEYYDGDQ